MEAQVITNDANVLKANKEHQNFTKTSEIIPFGTKVEGKVLNVDGLRRGEAFKYRLFITKDSKIIHLNKIKPMTTTEVTLGADAKQSPTVIDMAVPKKNFTKTTIIGAVIGAGLGYYYSAKMKGMDKKKVLMFSLGGAIVGLLAGKYVEHKRLTVTKAK